MCSVHPVIMRELYFVRLTRLNPLDASFPGDVQSERRLYVLSESGVDAKKSVYSA